MWTNNFVDFKVKQIKWLINCKSLHTHCTQLYKKAGPSFSTEEKLVTASFVTMLLPKTWPHNHIEMKLHWYWLHSGNSVLEHLSIGCLINNGWIAE